MTENHTKLTEKSTDCYYLKAYETIQILLYLLK